MHFSIFFYYSIYINISNKQKNTILTHKKKILCIVQGSNLRILR